MSDPFRVRVRVRRPAITRPDSKKFHLVHASAGSAAMAVAGLAGFTERPEAASPPSDPDAELTEALATSVDQLCTLLQGHDAFDVMALLRQLQTEIGYTLDDVLALRAAITAIIENAGRGVLDHLAMAAQPGDAYFDPVARAAARTPRDPRDADRRDHHPAAARPGDGVGSAEVPGARHDQPAGRPLGDVDNLPGG